MCVCVCVCVCVTEREREREREREWMKSTLHVNPCSVSGGRRTKSISSTVPGS